MYLHAIEEAIRADLAAGNYDRGIRLAKRSLKVDPRLEDIELSLARLLKKSGAHAAAAEQYSRYASQQQRDYGVNAPPLEDALKPPQGDR
jgi:two-component SAPR family response regulator